MAELPEIGKVSPDVFGEVILPRLGRPHPEVLVGPQSGVDVGIVRVAPGVVMATTTDPVFVVPAYGFARAAWFAVHILASDAAMSGLAPRYMTVDLNLPLEMTTAEFRTFWEAFHQAAADLDLAIISGHTARYEGCAYPMVGGATVFALGPEDAYVATNMARPGDVVVCTKGAAIEATGLFAATFPDRLQEALGPEVARAADALFEQMTVVRDARVAVGVGVRDHGVTSLHDATECGVLGGVYEIAEASGVGVHLNADAVIIRPEVEAVTRYFGIDPLASISEGTLLLTVRPAYADAVLEALAGAGIAASAIGEILPPEAGRRVTRGGRTTELVHPRVDPFWQAFARAAAGA
ncbi:putative Thiamine-phosphate kinase [Candidatus Hydrogenisulfobacillus filiaventi]|uniref:Putative Thiamine-phosphate kinase n=1 Tax=Candidatus Hydrogenisulfobacillus filiaventi TaxID=2707344 RepID=A0A6F8ZF53_9FIRM|nr:AIR synthase family protein [Bacillota bacterium]CAB1128324.1 putative Thiamine-phosphate kinase [Candidatus Hydrogenisulfobacillus filiaventi]